MKVKFTLKQVDYLESHLPESLKILIEKSGLQEYELSRDAIDAIGDWAEDELIRVGFDENYDLNEEGKILEDIADILFID